MMRFAMFLAVLVNGADLVATALGIHWLGNREANPMLAGLAQNHWWAFVLVKGVLVPLLIVRLYRAREGSPVLAAAGMAMVLVALTFAVGEWIGWIAGVLTVGVPRS